MTAVRDWNTFMFWVLWVSDKRLLRKLNVHFGDEARSSVASIYR